MRYLALAGSGGSEAALSVVERQAHPMFKFKAQYPPPNDPHRIVRLRGGPFWSMLALGRYSEGEGAR